LTTAEAELQGGKNEATVAAAAAASSAANEHPGDFRGNAEYRAEMAAILTRRVLNELFAPATD
jgi:CO/xanthine dehydrogenase FAD-binding subunit